MKIKSFKGDFFEIGEQQGKIYRMNGMSFSNVKIDPTLYRNQLRVYRKHYPELLKELKGMASIGKFDEDKLVYKFICGEILFKKQSEKGKACTIFGVKNKNGVFVGRNYDWLPATEDVFEVYKVENQSKNSFIGISDMGIEKPSNAKPRHLFYNPDDAINDKGLFIGLTFAHNDKWNYGLSSMDMIRLIAETCGTVDDALKVFKKVPLCCPKNFFIADRNGDMVVVEHTSKRFKTVYPKDNILIQTNHYIDDGLLREDVVLKENPANNTFLRYYETLQKIGERRREFKLHDVIKILGNIRSCVCQNNTGIKTIWSLALDMKKREYKLYWDLFGKRNEMSLSI